MNTETTDELALTAADRNNSLWKKVEEHALARIARLHKQLEHHAPPEQTAELRGRIKELRKLLAAGASQD